MTAHGEEPEPIARDPGKAEERRRFFGIYSRNAGLAHKIGCFCGDFTDFSEKSPDHPERRKKGQKRRVPAGHY